MCHAAVTAPSSGQSPTSFSCWGLPLMLNFSKEVDVNMDLHSLKNLAQNAESNRRGRTIASIRDTDVCVSRFSMHPKWEIHPHGQEVLVGISGELTVVVLHSDCSNTITIEAGDVVVIPENTWHSPVPNGEVSVLSIGCYRDTVVSDNEDPRV